MDVFDVCIILYNALNNCMESVNGEKPYIKVHAFRKNSIFMLIISNSFKGRLRIDPAEGIPYTAKKNGEHGIGLKNMRRVAKKYMGDLSFEQNGDEDDGGNHAPDCINGLQRNKGGSQHIG